MKSNLYLYIVVREQDPIVYTDHETFEDYYRDPI